MQTLNVVETGLSYLQACLDYYVDGCAYFLLYLLALIGILIRGTKRERQIFLPSALLLILSVYNPIFPVVLSKIFDVNKEYYRFFWLAPVIILVPYACTKLFFAQTDKTKKIIVGIGLALMLCLSGNLSYFKNYIWASNIYKMPEELMTISGLIHEDSEVEYPKVLMEYQYNMEMRQYDPSLLLTIDREDYLYAMSNAYPDEMLEDETMPQYKLLAKLIHYQNISDEAFKQALDATDTEYIVISSGNANVPYFGKNGYRLVSQTGNHLIFHYDLKERKGFELIDYTELRGE